MIITVDDTEYSETLTGDTDIVNSGFVHLGGSDDTTDLTHGYIRKNFIGYVKEVGQNGGQLLA